MRVLSGIQSSGKLHLGNYFGMLKPALEMQAKSDETYLFIADYHALTTVQDASALRAAINEIALDALALGLDHSRTAFYRQSDVPEVQELAWLLSVVTPMGLLERCHSYKDKIARGIAPSHGLFAYPVLMAADILAVQADIVPVGQDQKQHVEVTRDIAIKFNHQFGETFKIPKPLIKKEVAVVPGIDGQKMSKSYDNTIKVFTSEDELRKTVMRIVTDSKTVADKKDPEKCNLFALYKLFAPPDRCQQLDERYRKGGLGYGEVKKELAGLIWLFFAEARARREKLRSDPAEAERVLRQGAERARAVIRNTLQKARKAVGLE
ncbi:MAG: tryptophan--tRNA ligase [Kiritimatiellae bacterium]|nr:tryptophan--tRNA ligase [Kiritimatiellia bacterium]